MLDDSASEAELEVDGGVNTDTVRLVVEAGADIIVAGSAVYNDKYSVAQSIKNIKELRNTVVANVVKVYNR